MPHAHRKMILTHKAVWLGAATPSLDRPVWHPGSVVGLLSEHQKPGVYYQPGQSHGRTAPTHPGFLPLGRKLLPDLPASQVLLPFLENLLVRQRIPASASPAQS